MADFQISRGIVANLPTELSDGHIWFASDEGKFYIDCPDENGVLQRIALNAKNADMVLGTTPATSVNESDTEFPTSKAAMDYFASKHDPVFTGSFSIGRKEGTTVGEYSFAVGDDVEASGPYAVPLVIRHRRQVQTPWQWAIKHWHPVKIPKHRVR